MKRVLIIDDSGITRLQVRKGLENTDCEVYEAVNGEQVIDDTFHPEVTIKDMDLIILDFYLQDYNGIEMINKLHELEINIPIIILSSENKKENVIECIKLGVVDYITKPFNLKKLVNRISKILNNLDDSILNNKEDIRNINSILLEEIDRAIRSNTVFTVCKYHLEAKSEVIEKALHIIKGKLRSIDKLIKINKDSFLLLLPVTDLQGESIVFSKLETFFQEENLEIIMNVTNKVLFPEMIEDKDLIDNYENEEIKDIILNELDLIS